MKYYLVNDYETPKDQLLGLAELNQDLVGQKIKNYKIFCNVSPKICNPKKLLYYSKKPKPKKLFTSVNFPLTDESGAFNEDFFRPNTNILVEIESEGNEKIIDHIIIHIGFKEVFIKET